MLCTQAYWGLLGVMIVVGALSSIGSAGVRITVEAEAVSALAKGDSLKLSKLNAGQSSCQLYARAQRILIILLQSLSEFAWSS